MSSITELRTYSIEELFGIYAKDEIPRDEEFSTLEESFDCAKQELIDTPVRRTAQEYENIREDEEYLNA